MSLRPVIEWAINPSQSTRIDCPTADIDDGQLRVRTGISAELSPTGGFRTANPPLPANSGHWR
jgi:hypothetical protein